jgi:hypothetical protein
MLALTLLLLVPTTAPTASFATTHASVPTAQSRIETQTTPRYSLDEIIEAIRVTESGGHKDGGRHATGDGGRAIGPFQIHRAHWLDAGLAGEFQDCRDPGYARQVVVSYWKRWCPAALERCDAEVLARTHNGGPTGAKKEGTLVYWGKVEKALVRARVAAEQVAASK